MTDPCANNSAPQQPEIPVYEIDLAGALLTEQDLRRVLARAYADTSNSTKVTVVIKRISITAIPAVFLTY